MIVDDVKNSILKILQKTDKSMVLYSKKPPKVEFPYAILSLADFKIEPAATIQKQKKFLKFQVTFQLAENNTGIELLDFQERLSKNLLPVMKINNRKITLDDVNFMLLDKQLIFQFCLNFYTVETDKEEMMRTLDIDIQGG